MKWLDRSLIMGPYLALALSQVECNEVFEHAKIPQKEWKPWIKNSHSEATMHWIDVPSADSFVCVVALRPKIGASGIQIAALLVHEAVHVWQAFKEHIGEASPSAEFEAYSIQTIAQRLMQAYAERVTS